MNTLKLVSPGAYIYLLIGALSAAFMGGWHLRARIADGDMARHLSEQAHQAELQRIANRDRSRTAETGEGERVVYRDRVITKSVTEVRHATAPLADCPIPPTAVRVLNDAARCAREGRPATCFADPAVPGPR